MSIHPVRPFLPFVLPVLLCACGGGGSSSATTSATPPIPTPAPSALNALFAPLQQVSADPVFKYLKACYFPTQQLGTTGQAGITFLESLVIDTADTENAILYNAQNGNSERHTKRSYKGSSPLAGAPDQLWTGVMKLNADGSASGFGYPCTPTTMLDRPKDTCYWLGQDVNGDFRAEGAFTLIGDGRPATSTGAVTALRNPGWGTGTAYYFYYEMSYGPNCSAPNSQTIFRGRPLLGS